MIGGTEVDIPAAVLWGVGVGAFCFGAVVGALIGAAWVRGIAEDDRRNACHVEIDEDAARYWRDRGAV